MTGSYNEETLEYFESKLQPKNNFTNMAYELIIDQITLEKWQEATVY